MKLLASAFTLATVLSLATNGRLEAAESYHFQTTTEGIYPKHQEGTVVVDGKRWRIDNDVVPGVVAVFTAVIGTKDGEMVALNSSNHTWFRLTSRQQLEIDPYVFTFTYGEAVKASKVRVSVQLGAPERGDRPGSATSRITFSYRINAKVSSENVQGEVWGEIRLWATTETQADNLPWKAFDLHTGFDAVDEALQTQLTSVRGAVWQCETEVSRRLAGGDVLRQVIRRTIGPLTPFEAAPGEFTVPADYRYQEPVIGVP